MSDPISKEPTCHMTLLTPNGRGAVASIRVAGEDVLQRVAPLFRAASGQSLPRLQTNRIVYGHWHATAKSTEEVVVCRRAESILEIHCHGGQAASKAILRSLSEVGCREFDWRSWLRQECLDPIRCEARIALSSARTERAAGVLLDQYQGALRPSIERIRNDIQGLRFDRAAERLRELLRWSRLGLHLAEPWRVALVGPANAGKSSLINALLGYRRAIVHQAPGTTRDVVTAMTALNGWPIELADTAGLRSTSDAVERAGLVRTRRQLEQADLVVLVTDLSQTSTNIDNEPLGLRSHALLVHNKSDLVSVPQSARRPGLFTSALTGEGISVLMNEIVARLVPIDPPPGTPIPFTGKQVDALTRSLDQVLAGRAAAADGYLRDLLTATP